MAQNNDGTNAPGGPTEGEFENRIMNLVDEFLGAGWRPEQIVGEMVLRARRGSYAVDLVKTALVCRAGRWLDDDAMAGFVEEVDRFAADIGESIGNVASGWLGRWLWYEVGTVIGLDGVIDILEYLPDALGDPRHD